MPKTIDRKKFISKNPDLPPQVIRLNMVVSECVKDNIVNGVEDFATRLGTSRYSIYRMLKNELSITKKVTDGICTIFGYSEEWWISGTGKKKRDQKERSKLYDVQELAAKLNIMAEELKRLNARIAGQDIEIASLKQEISTFKLGHIYEKGH